MDFKSPAPHYEDTSFNDEVAKYWGRDWGIRTEYGQLRMVMLHRPGDELLSVGDPPEESCWIQRIKKEELPEYQKEHDAFAEAIRKEGVEVVYTNAKTKDRTKFYFIRDTLSVVDGGAIISRMAVTPRKGEEAFVQRRLAELGVPILHTIHGRGYYEGGNLMIVDEKTALIGTSMRTNVEGAKQAEEVLRRCGYEDVKIVPLPGFLRIWPPEGPSHLDVAINVIDEKMALIYPPSVPYDLLRWFVEQDFNLIEAPRNEALTNAVNVLIIKPGKVIIPDVNPTTIRNLEKEGVDAIPVSVSTLKRGGGGPRCMSMPLIRDKRPR